ncbi:MAG: Stp1/IreP family PP2C-type Ser/Thr phosphatase [Clostridia bacterium]|nr:Stp1/IreP family PP2C-type Ser/Thr phosphatase [Clostridia bacterium]
MKVYGLTDRGLVREVNEDCIGISTLANGITICVVCDGMGGAAGGKIASGIGEEVFVNTMASFAEEIEKSKFDSKKIKLAIKNSIEKANLAILESAKGDLSLYGMGCTLNALVFVDGKSKIYYANVGDSRLYMIKKREIKQLTKDHSYVQMLLDNKDITQEEAENHPQRNLITKALGVKEEIEPDIFDRRISHNNETYFLLCSDGLHGLVSKEMLKKVALANTSIEEKVFSYIKLANEAGGHDNISAILLCTKESEVTK